MTRILAAALAVPLLVATALAQQATFKSRVDLVSVDVLVSQGSKPVAGLAASDFEILDNKVPQKIDSISGEGTGGTIALRRVPLDVVLALDVSESMAGDKLEQLVSASKDVMAILRADDRAALVTFSQRMRIMQPLSSDHAAAARAIDGLYATGRTSMFDALYAGLSLRQTADTRSVVLLFSDGRDNSSWLSGTQLAQVARQSDVVVYFVGLDTRVTDEMEEITRDTGGAAIVARSAKDLKGLFQRIVREMQARYVLNYYPNGVEQGGWHTIDVRVPGRRAQVVARRGYWRR